MSDQVIKMAKAKYAFAARFVEHLESVDSLPQLNLVMAEALSEFGIEHFTCATIKGGPGEKDRSPLFGSYDSDWMQHYLNNRYYVEDLIFRHSQHTRKSFYWSDLISETKLTKAEGLVFEEGWDAGLKEGLAVPMEGIGGGKYVMSMAGPKFEKDEYSKAAILLMVNWALPRAKALGAGRITDNPLSKAQMHVMYWLAEGLTQKEAAEVMNLSPSTVANHVNEAKKLLNAATVPGAIQILNRNHMLS